MIAADPPWRFKTWSAKGRDRCPDAPMNNRPERHYSTMPLEDIAALPVQALAARDAVLLLWAVDSMLPDALDVGRSWGFTFKTVAFYWMKLRREGSTRGLHYDESDLRSFPIGTGYWTRPNPEQCLLFTRGAPKRLNKNVRKLIVAPRREHSRKPDEFYDRVRELTGGPYLDLFTRQVRPAWDQWGDEVGKFGGAA